MRAHALHFNHRAGQVHDNRFVGIFARERERDFGARFAAHSFDGIVHRHAARGFVVDFYDEIAAFHACALGGGVFNRRDDFHKAVFRADFHAQAAEFAGGGFFHFGITFFVHAFRMRVQPRHHAFDGFFQQFVVVGFVHIVGFNLPIHFRHGFERLDGQVVVGLFVGGETLRADAQRHTADCAAGVEGDFFPSLRHSCVSFLLLSCCFRQPENAKA